MVIFHKYYKVIELILSSDGIVRRVLVEYYIKSSKAKHICVDIRSLVILPTI